VSGGERPRGSGWDNLLRRVDAVREAGRAAQGAPASRVRAGATDFATLPGMAEQFLQRRLAEKLDLESPYFRVHEGIASARTVIDGRQLVNFSSYDYLGLNGDPRIAAAAKEAIDVYGISASASRCVAGERSVHGRLERRLADHYGVDECAVFVSGWMTNAGVIGELVGAKDIVLIDEAIHNSVLMGGAMSGAARRSFRHNDLDHLDAILAEARGRHERALIVVEGLYSMDGDYPDLARLVSLKKRHEAWLMVDEAHALGVLGEHGFGLHEQCSVDPRDVDIWMGTLSKALASCGGYIAGSAALVDYVKSLVGAFVYSVAMPPVIAAAADKALEVMRLEPERAARLRRNGAFFRDHARSLGLDTGTSCGAAVAPIIVGDSLPAALLSARLYERGFNTVPVIYPGVPARRARLRFFLTANHREDEIRSALDATAEELARVTEEVRRLRISVADPG
jgi:8-amino-7-oxononanoate synthase